MTNRERVRAILHYQSVDRVPVVAFGYWQETLQKQLESKKQQQDQLEVSRGTVARLKASVESNNKVLESQVDVLNEEANSLTAEILKLQGFHATEIYNSVSGVHMSRRADSSLIVDMLAMRGCCFPLIAADDAHYYDNDSCKSWIMVEAEDNAREYLIPAIRNGRFYATQGPEIHLTREGDEFVVTCSPVSEIVFHSNFVWSRRVFEGNGLTEARYTLRPGECFIRAEVTDRDGKRAWSRIIPV